MSEPAPMPLPESARRRVLAEAVGGGTEAGLLFEHRGPCDGGYSVVASHPVVCVPSEPEPTLTPKSLLPRWLRVNNKALDVPDSLGVFDVLEEHDRRLLKLLSIAACVPLVADGHLVAWIGLISPTEPDRARRRAATILPQASHWAERLQHADRVHRESIRAAALSRSSRLTVAGQMAAAIAHEVRNPLHTVRASLQWVLDKEYASPHGAEYLTTALGEVDRMNSALGLLLKFTRSEPTPATACDLREIVETAVVICTPYARRQSQQIRCTHMSSLPILASPDEVHQVVVNLLLNSVQASNAGATILAATGLERDERGMWATLRVIDRGAGIPPALTAQIFEPFFSTKHDGGGLGLWICRNAVDRHGGGLTIESEVGHGTCATVRLPVQDTHGADSPR